jgi:hypothetical protein
MDKELDFYFLLFGHAASLKIFFFFWGGGLVLSLFNLQGYYQMMK